MFACEHKHSVCVSLCLYLLQASYAKMLDLLQQGPISILFVKFLSAKQRELVLKTQTGHPTK